ncbi:doublecortin domain-containing protein 2-like [Ptychodera flava]|uniref:doublecortin domain-containing protein 2-like n=1 Tax=Ptychodera flava TaxID=63121 RepID=UPI00396A04C1
MTTRAVDPVTAKSVHIYRNGDGFYAGRKFVVNQKQIRNFDSFLNQVTTGIRANAAVRNIYTPVNGHRVHDLDRIETGSSYVAAGMERFKKIEYSEITSKRPQNKPRFLDEIKPVQHSIYKDKVGARWREWVVQPCSIHVYRNGDDKNPAVKLLLPRKALQSWDMVLDYVTDRVNLRTGAVRRLYSIEGRPIVDLKDITNGEYYVAVGMDRKFKKVPYGQDISPVNSPRSVRTLPPLNRPRPPPAQTRTLHTQPAGPKTTRRIKEREETTPPKPKPTTYSNNQRKVKRGAKKSEEKTEAESVFHSKPTIVKRSREKEDDQQLKYDDDPNGVYKAKEKREETRDATEVKEDNDTAVDLPIDQVAAEEVEDEDIQPATDEPEFQDDDTKASEPDNKSEPDEQINNRGTSPPQRTPTPSRISTPNQSPPPKSPTLSTNSNATVSRPKSAPVSSAAGSKQNTPKASHEATPQQSPPQSASRTVSPAKSPTQTFAAEAPTEENREEDETVPEEVPEDIPEDVPTQEDISVAGESEAPPTEAPRDGGDTPSEKPKEDDDDASKVNDI